MSIELLLAAVVGYLLGSLPFGLLITRFAGLGDIRAIGSGNIGATNVLRTGRKGLAALTLLADMAKGFAPVLLFASLYDLFPHGLVAGFAALIGHMFPLWLKFQGGKGVATYIGALAGFGALLGFVFVGVWLSIAFLFRYSSLSALVAAAVMPVAGYFTHGSTMSLCLLFMSGLVIIRHHGNIQRLLSGKEDKIGQKQSD